MDGGVAAAVAVEVVEVVVVVVAASGSRQRSGLWAQLNCCPLQASVASHLGQTFS